MPAPLPVPTVTVQVVPPPDTLCTAAPARPAATGVKFAVERPVTGCENVTSNVTVAALVGFGASAGIAIDAVGPTGGASLTA